MDWYKCHSVVQQALSLFNKPKETLEKLSPLSSNIEQHLSEEDEKALKELEPTEIMITKKINKLVEIINTNAELSEKNAKTANFLSWLAIWIAIISILVTSYHSMQPTKIEERQFNQLLNRLNQEEITQQQQQSNQKVYTELDSNVLMQQTVTRKMKHK